MFFNGPAHKFHARAPGKFWESVKSAAGRDEFVIVLQSGHQHVALAPVGFFGLPAHVHIQRFYACPLERMRRADETELLELDHLANDRRWSVGESQTPARHAIGLAE